MSVNRVNTIAEGYKSKGILGSWVDRLKSVLSTSGGVKVENRAERRRKKHEKEKGSIQKVGGTLRRIHETENDSGLNKVVDGVKGGLSYILDMGKGLWQKLPNIKVKQKQRIDLAYFLEQEKLKKVAAATIKPIASSTAGGVRPMIEKQPMRKQLVEVEQIEKKIKNDGIELPSLPKNFIGIILDGLASPDGGTQSNIKISDITTEERILLMLGSQAVELNRYFGKQSEGTYAQVRNNKLEVVPFDLSHASGKVKDMIKQINQGILNPLAQKDYFHSFIQGGVRKLLSDIQIYRPLLSLNNFEDTVLRVENLRTYNSILSDDELNSFILKLEKQLVVLKDHLKGKLEGLEESIKTTNTQLRDVFGRFTTVEKKERQDRLMAKGVEFRRKKGKVIPFMSESRSINNDIQLGQAG